eukprot:11221636-Lingulodinium_polyedra.AAC.1
MAPEEPVVREIAVMGGLVIAAIDTAPGGRLVEQPLRSPLEDRRRLAGPAAERREAAASGLGAQRREQAQMGQRPGLLAQH